MATGANYRLFWQEFRRTFHSTGAVLPSGRALCRALAKYAADLSRFSASTTESLTELESGAEVSLGGILTLLKPLKTKKGDRMAVIQLEDLTGSVEAVISLMTIANGVIPPTINYERPDPDVPLDVVPNEARAAKVRTVLSNSFGFGGQNVCLVLAAAPT